MSTVTTKPDTVLAVDCDVDDSADLSQVDQPLIAVVYSTQECSYILDPIPDTLKPTGAGAGSEITVRFTWSKATYGYLITWGNDSGSEILVDLSVGQSHLNDLLFIKVNGTIYELGFPDAPTTAVTALLSVNLRPNPFTTGASDAIVCDAYLYDESDWAHRQIMIPEIVHTSGHSFAIGGRIVDSTTDWLSYTWGPAVYPDDVRVGLRAKSMAEIKDDYGLRTAPTAAGGVNTAPMQANVETSDRLVSDDAVAGPVYQMAGHHIKHTGRRGVGTVVYRSNIDAVWQGSLYAIDTLAGRVDQKLECQGTPAVTDGPSGPSEPAFRMDNGGFLDSGAAWVSDMASDYSLSAWVRAPALAGSGQLIAVCGFFEDESGSPSNAFGELSIDENGALYYRNQDGAAGSGTTRAATSSSSLITADTWHHIAVTVDKSGSTENVTFWVDGVEDSTVNINSAENYSGSPFCLGGTYDGTTFTNAAIDIAAIRYDNTVFPDTVIEFEARQGQGVLWQTGGTASDSYHHWPMNENGAGFTPQKLFMPLVEAEGTVHLSLADSFKRRCSSGASHAKVTIYYTTRHATGGTYSDDQRIRVYSHSAAPGKLYFPPEPIESYSVVSGSLDASTVDVLVLDGLKIARNADGDSWFTLGYNSDAAESQIMTSIVQIDLYSKEIDSDYPMIWGEP